MLRHRRKVVSWPQRLGTFALVLLALALGFVGVSLVMSGLAQMRIVKSLDQDAVEQDAVVVRIESSTHTDSHRADNRTRTISLPVMGFRYEDREYEFTAQAVGGDRRFSVGETVPVVFPPGAPQFAVLSEFRNEAWAVQLFLGLALLVAPAMLLYLVVQTLLRRF